MKKTLIALAASMICAATANAGITGLGLGIHGGIVSGYKNPILQESIIINPTYAGFDLTNKMTDIGAHLNIGTLQIIDIVLDLDYAWKKQQIISGLDLTFSDVSIAASVKKSLPLPVVKPYAGLGVAMHWVAYSLSVGGHNIVLPDNQSKLGLIIRGGVELSIPMFPLTPFLEYRYNTIQTTGKAVHYSAIIGGLTLNLP